MEADTAHTVLLIIGVAVAAVPMLACFALAVVQRDFDGWGF